MTTEAGFKSQVLVKRLPRALASARHARAAFDIEKQVLATLTHPNIVRLLRAGEHDGSPFIVLEWVDGMNLEVPIDVLADRGRRMPFDMTVEIMQAVSEALEHAHGELVHRDIKPSNILIDRSGTVKLADFGCAKGMAEASNSRTTKTGTMRGTLPYMPPERVLERPFDKRADIYAAGVVFYEMLTGYNPFLDATDYLTLERIIEAPIPPPSVALDDVGLQAPPELPHFDAVVMRAIERDPEARFGSAREMGEAVLAAAEAAGIAPSRKSLKALVAALAPPNTKVTPPLGSFDVD